MLTFLPLEEIDKMDGWEGSKLNEAKEILAYELTKLVHGEDEAQKAQSTARAIFSSGDAENMPTVEITNDDLRDGAIDIQAILVKAGLATSRSDARRSVEGGGVSVDGEKVTDPFMSFKPEDIGDGRVVKKGKKNFKKIIFG